MNEADPHRPRYHFVSPANWMNDPNGLIQWRGRYHLFYQYNPNGAFHGTIHWGHAVSDDLVRWRHLPIALAPTSGGPDRDGVFSGCAVEADGTPTLMYTGIRPEVQCLATPIDPEDPDLVEWRKHPANPVIAAPPNGLAVEGFRDPFVWREGDEYRCVLGSGVKGESGVILLYRSRDLVDWRYVGELCRGRLDESGRMWECPNFFPLGGKHVLLISPIPLQKALYMVGTYAGVRFTSEVTGIVDDGGSVYAPQVMRDQRGRWLMWGWLREGRNKEAQLRAGWSGVMSLPTVVSLGTDGALEVRPAPEIESLRAARTDSGRHLEIDAELEPGGVISVLRSPGGEEETRIVYADGRLSIDRSRSSLDDSVDKEPRGCDLPIRGDRALRLRVFVDGSVVAVYADDRVSLTSRVYPTRPDAVGVDFSGPARPRNIWEMS